MTVAATGDPNVISLEHRRATRQLAQKLSKCLKAGDLVILDGQLGSGKTFLVRALCRALGLPERVRVTSPTFSLLHEIGTTPRITHADLYRLSKARDLLELGLVERREDGDLLLVEWGMPYVEELGGDALILEFAHDPRRVHVRATGERSGRILTMLHQLHHSDS
ncbi:MAG TPA: tRNA (adenosine(37)-N6)-threonylcarbamoyltransferase complex ATPase subunit type 1 TsaE [Polyangiaceae bacterium]